MEHECRRARKLRGKHPIIDQILDYRMLTKLKSTYADGLLKDFRDPDGRIQELPDDRHGDRTVVTEPNLQEYPMRRELGARSAICSWPRPGKVLVDADYSQIELRLLAHILGDGPCRSRPSSSGGYIRRHGVAGVGVPLEEVTPLQRSHAKAVNFGIV